MNTCHEYTEHRINIETDYNTACFFTCWHSHDNTHKLSDLMITMREIHSLYLIVHHCSFIKLTLIMIMTYVSIYVNRNSSFALNAERIHVNHCIHNPVSCHITRDTPMTCILTVRVI